MARVEKNVWSFEASWFNGKKNAKASQKVCSAHHFSRWIFRRNRQCFSERWEFGLGWSRRYFVFGYLFCKEERLELSPGSSGMILTVTGFFLHAFIDRRRKERRTSIAYEIFDS